MDEALFTKVPVKVQQKSGFDLSFQNLLTTKVGTITPILCEEVIPNETVHLSAAIQAQLPPLATDTFMRCNLKYEAFFVPTRIIFPGYEGWLCPGSQYNSQTGQYIPVAPVLQLKSDEVQRGSLADYLGFKTSIPSGYSADHSNKRITVTALPFLAYHKIYDDWYRNSLVQSPVFRDRFSNGSAAGYNASNALNVAPCDNRGYVLTSSAGTATTATSSTTLVDGVKVFELRQRNFGIDYFTSATPKAQNGDAMSVNFVTTATTGSFTIAELRAANSVQQWLERNNLAGNRMVDYVKANYGANLSYGVAQKSVLLGSGQFPVYSKGVYQNGPSTSGDVSSKNPFTSIGAKYGSAFASGKETIIKSFTANEPGYIFVMVTLVPKVTYSTGIDRKLLRYTAAMSSDPTEMPGTQYRSEMANPMLQNVGPDKVYCAELNSDYAFVTSTGLTQAFGFTEKYASWKSKQDEIHGLLRENNSTQWDQGTGDDTGGLLGAFALQSSFVSSAMPSISSDFLQIPTTYLDQICATTENVSKYGCWIDSYLDFRVSMPLARYSMPSLQDPAYEHGNTIVLDRGGKRL